MAEFIATIKIAKNQLKNLDKFCMENGLEYSFKEKGRAGQPSKVDKEEFIKRHQQYIIGELTVYDFRSKFDLAESSLYYKLKEFDLPTRRQYLAYEKLPDSLKNMPSDYEFPDVDFGEVMRVSEAVENGSESSIIQENQKMNCIEAFNVLQEESCEQQECNKLQELDMAGILEGTNELDMLGILEESDELQEVHMLQELSTFDGINPFDALKVEGEDNDEEDEELELIDDAFGSEDMGWGILDEDFKLD